MPTLSSFRSAIRKRRYSVKVVTTTIAVVNANSERDAVARYERGEDVQSIALVSTTATAVRGKRGKPNA